MRLHSRDTEFLHQDAKYMRYIEEILDLFTKCSGMTIRIDDFDVEYGDIWWDYYHDGIKPREAFRHYFGHEVDWNEVTKEYSEVYDDYYDY